MARPLRRSSWFPLLLLAAVIGTPVHAQSRRATLTARVTDDGGSPIIGAGVWVDGVSTLTDEAGRAVLSGISPGPHLVRVRADGYQAEAVTLAFEEGATVEIDAQLESLGDVIGMPIISVEVERQVPHLRRSGFYQRKQLGFGTFLQRDPISSWDHLPSAAHLFRGVRGMSVTLEGSEYVIRSSRGVNGFQPGGCVPQIVVDGLPWRTEDLAMLPASDIEAVEVYSGPATSPPQFAFSASGTSCGTVVIWRRRGGRGA